MFLGRYLWCKFGNVIRNYKIYDQGSTFLYTYITFSKMKAKLENWQGKSCIMEGEVWHKHQIKIKSTWVKKQGTYVEVT